MNNSRRPAPRKADETLRSVIIQVLVVGYLVAEVRIELTCCGL
jgi:hypothetical protein